LASIPRSARSCGSSANVRARALDREAIVGTPKAIVRIGAGLAVTAGCLALAFRSVHIGDLLSEVTDVDIVWLGVAALAQLISIVVRAARTHALLHRRVRYGDVFWPLSIGLFLSNILPLRAGEIARAFLISRRSGLPVGHVGATILLENVLDLLMLGLLLAIQLPLLAVPSGIVDAGLLLGGTGVLFALALLMLVVFHRQAHRIGIWLGRILPLRVQTFVGAQWIGMLAGLSALGSPATALGALGFTILSWGAAMGGFWAMIEAISPGGSPLEASFVVTAVTLSSVVPASPGGVGVYELIGQQALLLPFPGRFTAASALSITLLSHAIFYVLTIVIGLVGMLRVGISLTSLRTVAGADSNSEAPTVQVSVHGVHDPWDLEPGQAEDRGEEDRHRNLERLH
jgi:uncharacterized protein (TIRG00374 family)